MDAHAKEAAGAVAGIMEAYGTAAGNWDGHRRRWQVDDYVLFWLDGYLSRGHVMEVVEGVEHDRYLIRTHVEGGGSKVVEVRDMALLPY